MDDIVYGDYSSIVFEIPSSPVDSPVSFSFDGSNYITSISTSNVETDYAYIM